MFRKILLPLDLTEKHGAAVDAAADAAKQSGGTVELLHVIEIMPGLSFEDEKPFYQRLERVARKHLERWGQQLTRCGVTWQAEVLFGARSQEVVRRAGEQQFELVVLTAPRVTPENVGVGLGSVSYRVSLLAPCPVLLVK